MGIRNRSKRGCSAKLIARLLIDRWMQDPANVACRTNNPYVDFLRFEAQTLRGREQEGYRMAVRAICGRVD